MKILLAVDDSPTSYAAAELAAAWFPDADVTAFHVQGVDAAVVTPLGLAGGLHGMGAGRGWMAPPHDGNGPAEAAAEITDGEARTVSGPISATILSEAEEGGHDLVIVGSKDRSALESFLLGSVSGTVAKKSTCPVLVVPA